MQGQILKADDYQSSKTLTLIALRPRRTGEARLLTKIRASGERSLRVVFVENSNEMRLVIPDTVTNLPDSVGRGRHAKD